MTALPPKDISISPSDLPLSTRPREEAYICPLTHKPCAGGPFAKCREFLKCLLLTQTRQEWT